MPPSASPTLYFGGTNPLLIIIVLMTWLLKMLVVNISAALIRPAANVWHSGPLTWCCWCVETSISAVLSGGQTIESSDYVINSAEYRFANSVVSQATNRVQAAASEVLMHTYANRRFPTNQTGVTEGDNSAMSSESSEGTEPVENTGTERLRADFSRLRHTINENEDAQTICTFFTALLPFLLVFLLKAVVDCYQDLSMLIAGNFFFFSLDMYIQLWISGGTLNINQKLGSMISLVAGLAITSNTVFSPIEDFSLINCLSLRYAGNNFHGFLGTLLIVLLVDNFVKLVTCAAKIVLFILPCASVHQKRRLFQCTEYVSQMYRCVLPAPQWFYYFIGDSPDSYKLKDYGVAFIYNGLKARELIFIGIVLLDACRRALQGSNYGSYPTQKELDEVPMCSICHDKLHSPTKLPCTHIFCHECIDTWLDKEQTCPMCRAVVEKKNNQWKTGATSKLIRFY